MRLRARRSGMRPVTGARAHARHAAAVERREQATACSLAACSACGAGQHGAPHMAQAQARGGAVAKAIATSQATKTYQSDGTDTQGRDVMDRDRAKRTQERGARDRRPTRESTETISPSDLPLRGCTRQSLISGGPHPDRVPIHLYSTFVHRRCVAVERGRGGWPVVRNFIERNRGLAGLGLDSCKPVF